MFHTLPQFQISDTTPTLATDSPVRDDRQSCLVRIYPAGVSGSLIPLTFRRVTIGRDEDCTIEISDDFMSRTIVMRRKVSGIRLPETPAG